MPPLSLKKTQASRLSLHPMHQVEVKLAVGMSFIGSPPPGEGVSGTGWGPLPAAGAELEVILGYGHAGVDVTIQVLLSMERMGDRL